MYNFMSKNYRKLIMDDTLLSYCLLNFISASKINFEHYKSNSFLPVILKICSIYSFEEMMDMFVFSGAVMPVAAQIAFTRGISLVFLISAAITMPAIIASAMRGKGDVRG